MKWFLLCLKNYVNFSGRAPRKEYWFYTLFVVIFMVIAAIVDLVLFDSQSPVFYSLTALFFFLPNLAVWTRRLHDLGRSGWNIFWYYIVGVIWVVALIVAGVVSMGSDSLASSSPIDVSALVGQSERIGFLLVLGIGCLVFFVWAIVLFVWLCTKGTDGDNKYGPDPLSKQLHE